MHKIVGLTTILLLSPEALSFQADTDPTEKILVLDAANDSVDGPELIEVLDAYVNDMGVVTELSLVETVPATHAEWAQIAIRRGEAAQAVASIWTEPSEGGMDRLNVFLVVHAERTESAVVLPVARGIKLGSKLYRRVAAVARMVLDTDLLTDLEAVAEVAEAEEPPEPWDSGTQNDSKKRDLDKTKRGLGLALQYAGDLGLRGKSYNQGITAGLRLFLRPELSALVGGGVLFSTTETKSGISARQLRIPILLGMGGHLDLGKVTVGMTLFWMIEVVRLVGLEWPAGVIETNDANSRVDTGGGIELSLGIPLTEKVGVLFGLVGTGMVVSHQYRALGTDWFLSSPFRLGFRAGVSFSGL